MTWKKGQSGSPRGPKADKIITDAMRTALMESAKEGDFKKCRALATRLVDDAIQGDNKAAELVLERIEGKVPQQLDTNMNVSDNFMRLLELVSTGALTHELGEGVDAESGQSKAIRH